MNAVLNVNDFVETQEFYRIPRFPDQRSEARLTGVISIAQNEFLSKFNISYNELIPENSEILEALKYFTFYVWLKTEYVKKTNIGTPAKPRFSDSDATMDLAREVYSFNACIGLLKGLDKDKTSCSQRFGKFCYMKNILNY